MLAASTFPDQVRHWLESLHYQCEAEKGPYAPFTLLTARSADRPQFCLILVSLEAWQHSGPSESAAQDMLAALLVRRKAGITTIVLWEDYWLTKKPIVISRLMAMQGVSVRIPARLTQVRRTDNVTTTDFLTVNHLNGPTSSKFRYGLYLPRRYYRILPPDYHFDSSSDEMLVAVATFSNARIFTQHNEPFRSHELIRFGSLLNTNVVGGLDKLLRAFTSEKHPDDIMTYADLEWSDGAGYAKLGFERRDVNPPARIYLDPADLSRHTRLRAGTGKLEDNKISPIGYLTVYNMGSIKFVRTIKQFNHEV